MKLASWRTRLASPLLAGTLALLPAVAAADEFHFETFRFGQRAMGMGGAVTAYADEPEASYYNPAGLAMLSGTRFSGALNFVGLDRRVLTDGLRAGSLLTPQDLESSDFLPIPGSSVLTTDFGEGRHVLGLATFLHSDSEERFSGARTQTQDGSFASARTSVERRREDEIGLRGLVYGFRVSRDFAVGGALLLASQERTEVNRRAEVLQRRSTGDSVFVDASTREDTTTHSLLARVGVLWRPSEQWSYGLACSSPSLTLLGEADLSYTRIVSGDPDAGERPLLIDQRATPDAVTVLPAHCRGGLAWRVPEKLVLTFDLSAHFPTGYDRFELTNGLEARAAQLGERVEGDLTVNAGLGVEWRPSPRVPLRMGVFTNRTQAPEIAAQPTELGPPHVDLYGVTLSGGYLGDDRSINLGAELQVGEGHDALPSDLNSLIEDRDFRRIDRQEWRVVFFVSGAVAFAKKQATELMEAWK
jgi:hypothetical protein